MNLETKKMLSYPESSISKAVFDIAKKHPKNNAITFMNKSFSYKVFVEKTTKLSEAFCFCGVKKGDRVLVALPNIPQAVFALYSLNAIGAVGVFVSPLSVDEEIRHYIKKCKCKLAFVLDSLYSKSENTFLRSGVKVITTGVCDELSPLKRFIYHKTNPTLETNNKAFVYHTLMSGRYEPCSFVDADVDDTAVILFSGGTTGTPKAVEITNANLNALALGTEAMCMRNVKGIRMLAVLPVFHGFGLGICVHTVLFFGGNTLLLPKFSKELAAKTIVRHKPQYIACVPSMLEPMMSSVALRNADLSFLDGVFSGGDSLSESLRLKFDEFLKSHGAKVKIRQGYGATECVAAVCLMPDNIEKAESVGLVYPDAEIKIMASSDREADAFETGEIVISSKTVMKGYFDDEAETQKALKTGEDGKIWLYTGDVGYKDNEGYIYFKQRLKRVIISNGYNVYPSEIEKAFASYKGVAECCAVGVKDNRKIQVVALLVVRDNRYDLSKEDILAYLSDKVSRHSMPEYVIFTDSLPKTALGKIRISEAEMIAEELKETAD